MKKFYTFKAGQAVPKWMFDFTCSDKDMHKNKHGKIKFGRSVLAVRETGKHTKLIPSSGGDSYIKISDFDNANLGGVNGATGVNIRGDHLQSDFGKGLVYTVSK